MANAVKSIAKSSRRATLAVGALVLLCRPDAQAQVHADDVKVALVGKIATFITWPAPADLGKADTPFDLAIFGSTPLADRLVAGYRGTRIAGRPVRVSRVKDVRDALHAHLLFIGADSKADVEKHLRTLGTAPVLTMADSPGYAHRGVAINLIVQGGRVGFEINRHALARHGLSASYRLLALARMVP